MPPSNGIRVRSFAPFECANLRRALRSRAYTFRFVIYSLWAPWPALLCSGFSAHSLSYCRTSDTNLRSQLQPTDVGKSRVYLKLNFSSSSFFLFCCRSRRVRKSLNLCNLLTREYFAMNFCLIQLSMRVCVCVLHRARNRNVFLLFFFYFICSTCRGGEPSKKNIHQRTMATRISSLCPRRFVGLKTWIGGSMYRLAGTSYRS